MVSVRGDHLEDYPLEKVAIGPRVIPTEPAEHGLIKAAREIGVCFGD